MATMDFTTKPLTLLRIFPDWEDSSAIHFMIQHLAPESIQVSRLFVHLRTRLTRTNIKTGREGNLRLDAKEQLAEDLLLLLLVYVDSEDEGGLVFSEHHRYHNQSPTKKNCTSEVELASSISRPRASKRE